MSEQCGKGDFQSPVSGAHRWPCGRSESAPTGDHLPHDRNCAFGLSYRAKDLCPNSTAMPGWWGNLVCDGDGPVFIDGVAIEKNARIQITHEWICAREAPGPVGSDDDVVIAVCGHVRLTGDDVHVLKDFLKCCDNTLHHMRTVALECADNIGEKHTVFNQTAVIQLRSFECGQALFEM